MKPEETIDFHLRWLWMKIMRLYNTEASKFGGTMSVGFVLLNIDKEGTPSTKLGPKMGIESRSLTRALKTMEQAQLIRKKADAKDGRLVRIHLTEAGKQYRDTARQKVLALNTYLQSQLSSKEIDQFFKTAAKINALLDTKDIFKPEKTTKKLT